MLTVHACTQFYIWEGQWIWLKFSMQLVHTNINKMAQESAS